MLFDVLTLFPDLIYSYCDESILGRAQKQGLINVRAHNFRAFANNKWRHVDDKPYGGGPGMILQVEPIYECLASIGALLPKLSFRGGSPRGISVGSRKKRTEISRFARNDRERVIVLDPAGKKFDQRMAEKYSKLDRLVLICGRYEGFDARIYKLADERVSVGDYVLAGGELAALCILESVSRLIPRVLGNEESLKEETFARKSEARNSKSETNSKLKNQNFEFRISNFEFAREYAQYTRPENFLEMKVPKVLLSGDHKKIEEWRKKQSQ